MQELQAHAQGVSLNSKAHLSFFGHKKWEFFTSLSKTQVRNTMIKYACTSQTQKICLFWFSCNKLNTALWKYFALGLNL